LLAEANMSAQKGFAYRLIILNSPLSILNLASNLPIVNINIANFKVNVKFFPFLPFFYDFGLFLSIFGVKGSLGRRLALTQPSRLSAACP